MSFGLGSQGQPAFGGAASSSGNVTTGPALQEITTENLGFHALAGDTKLQLFPNAWPSDSLPPPSSSLLSISSSKGLIAAASPDSVVIATTAAVRDAFSNEGGGDGTSKAFKPQLTIPIGTRISQVAFSSDGSHLVISAQAGGGLAVYDTQALLNNNTQSTFELGTDQVSLRALVPNPAPESAHLFALVTTKGDLMMADMKQRSFVNGPGGKVLKSGVSCVSWSNKGKQLVAGMGNGSGSQMTPEGAVKAEVPRPPDLQGDQHVSSAYWLENDLFLLAYTPNATDDMPPATEYRLITRQPKTQNYAFQTLPEVCSPFGFNRQPSYQFMSRLRSFPPSLADLIIVASTSSDDVCLYTRASQPLASDAPESANEFTMTSLADDSRRAAIPMAEMVDSTSAVGMALDLSSTAKVPRPIPGEDIEESAGPLPAVFILNHLGVLSGWWVIYNDSVRQGTSYPGLTAVGGEQPTQPKPQASTTAFGQSSTPAFGSTPSLGSSSAFGAASKPAAATGGGAFGSTLSLGNQSSPWGGASSAASSTPAFGQSSFGQPSFGSTSSLGAAQQAPAFGSSGGLGSKPSVWGTTSQSATGSAFGQPSGLGSQKSNPFGGAGPSTTASSSAFGSVSGGFASFASSGGFASAASTTPNAGGESIFKQGTGAAPDASKKPDSIFGGSSQTSAGSGAFGSSNTGFTLGSAWKNPNAGKDSDSKPQGGTGLFGSEFSSGFSSALDSTKTEATPLSKEADMMSDEGESGPQTDRPGNDSTPTNNQNASTAPGGLFGTKPQTGGLFSAPSATGGLFSAPSAKEAVKTPTKPSPFPPKLQDTATPITQKPAATVFSAPQQNDGKPVDKSTPNIRKEAASSASESPLPPESTSKASYTPGNSSSSSASVSKISTNDPPLPPNPFSAAAKPAQKTQAEDTSLPRESTQDVPNLKTEDPPLSPSPAQVPSANEAPKSMEENKQTPKGSSALTVYQPEEDKLPGSSDSGLDEEGSGIDVAQEATAENSPDISPVSSFGTKTDKNSMHSSFRRAGDPSEGSSRQLFGEVGSSAIPNLGPPRKAPESPRSPSPVRAGMRNALRPDSSRSVSAPGVPLRVDGQRKVTLGRPTAAGRMYPPIPSAEESLEEERERIAQKKAQAKADAEQELSDGEHEEKRRDYLNEEAEATLVPPEFTAHQDYVGNIAKPGIPGQCERLYRDINSMVDTLGLNAQVLGCFIKGHEELGWDEGRAREDLENDENWTLSEIDNLIDLQDNLADDLEFAELTDPAAMESACADIAKDLERLKTRQIEVKRSVDAKLNPKLLESLRLAALSTEQATLRSDLRAKHTELQRALAQCEEAVSMLKAKTSSLQAAKAKSNGAPAVPTAEAVEKTILKMTSMFEKRSGDIDVLEAQMKQLDLGASVANSREGTPFRTPPPERVKVEASPASSVNGRSFYTPGSRRSGLAASIAGTPSRSGRSPGKKMTDIDDELAQHYAFKASRKRDVRQTLKKALIAQELRVRTLDDL